MRDLRDVPDHEVERNVIVCLGPVDGVVRVAKLFNAKRKRVELWNIVRFWYDGEHTWATMRRRFDH